MLCKIWITVQRPDTFHDVTMVKVILAAGHDHLFLNETRAARQLVVYDEVEFMSIFI